MNTTPDYAKGTSELSRSSSGDSHHELPVLASALPDSSNRRLTASSEGTRAPEDNVVEGEKSAPVQTAVAEKGSPSRGPPFRNFGHNFFDPEIAPLRKVVFKIVLPYVAMLTIVMWLALSLYWGSFWQANSHTENLTVMILNRDSTAANSLGTAILSAGMANANGSSTYGSNVGRLGFYEGSISEYPDDESARHAVLENEIWGVIVVNKDATARLQTARETGDASYNPRSAISFYYNQARMENAVNGYLVPLTSSVLTQATEKWSAQSVASYYFTFVFSMAFNVVRDIIGPKLKLRSYLAFRFIVPLIVYGWLSLNLAMINLPFKLPFDAKYSYAGGFFLWWAVLYAGMIAVGLALEFCIVLMTPRFVAFALLPIIIVQVSVVSLPNELQPRLYRYGVATPFYRVSNAVRTIIFNTKNDIGLDFGILLAWGLLSAITVAGLTVLFRRREVQKDRAKQEKTAVKA